MSMRMVVVLPAPLGPRNPNISPRATVRSRGFDGGELAVAAREPLQLDHRLPECASASRR